MKAGFIGLGTMVPSMACNCLQADQRAGGLQPLAVTGAVDAVGRRC